MLKNTHIIFAYSFTYLVEWPNRETPGLGHRKGKCKAISWQCPFPAAFAGRAAHYADRSPRCPQKHTLYLRIYQSLKPEVTCGGQPLKGPQWPPSPGTNALVQSLPLSWTQWHSKEQNMVNHGTSLLKLVYKKIPDSTLWEAPWKGPRVKELVSVNS